MPGALLGASLFISFDPHSSPVGMWWLRIVPSDSLFLLVKWSFFPTPLMGGSGMWLPLGYLKISENRCKNLSCRPSERHPMVPASPLSLCHETNTSQKGCLFRQEENRAPSCSWPEKDLQSKKGRDPGCEPFRFGQCLSHSVI